MSSKAFAISIFTGKGNTRYCSYVISTFHLQTNALIKPFSWYEPNLDPVKGYGKSYNELSQHNTLVLYV